MRKYLLGVSILPMLLIMPAMATEYTERTVIAAEDSATYTGDTFSGITNNVGNGGAIYNAGELTLTGATFTNNVAQNEDQNLREGGAIYNVGSLTVNDSLFEGNGARRGSAIFNGNAGNVVVNDSTFKNHNDGWYVFWDVGHSLEIHNSIFEDNNMGVLAAIHNSDANRTWLITDSTFRNNNNSVISASDIKSITISDSEFTDNDEGIVELWYTDTVNLSGLTFHDNIQRANATSDGTVLSVANTTTSVTIDDITMENNKLNELLNLTQNAVNTVSNVAMRNNNVEYGITIGGTDWYPSHTTLENITMSGNTFKDEMMTVAGGDYSHVDFDGTNTFTNNVGAKVAFRGVQTFKSGSTTTFDNVAIYKNVYGNTGETIVENGATLNLGTSTVVQQSFTLDGVVNATLKNADNFAYFDISDTFGGTGTLNFTLGGVGEYRVFQGEQVFDTTGTISIAESNLFVGEWNDAGNTITVTTKPVDEIAANTGLSKNAAGMFVALAKASNDKATLAVDAIQDAIAAGDTAYVEHETVKSAPAEKPVAHSIATATQGQVLTIASDRMSIANPVGRNGGDVNADFGVWARGLYNNTRYAGHFDGNAYGVAVGADVALNRKYMLGLGYAYNTADITAHNHGTTDVDTHSVFVYGQYKPSKWFANATLNYGMSNYNEHIRQFGLVEIGGKYDVQTFGGQIATGYDFANGITPMLGLRYMHMTQDDYKRDAYDMRISGTDSDFLTGVAGMKYNFLVNTGSKWRLVPEVRAGVKYDLISDDMESTVTMPGVASYTVGGEQLSRFGGEFGLGINGEYRGVQLSLLYDVDIRKDYISQTGMFKARYEF